MMHPFRTILLIFLSFPLLSLSCSKEKEPPPVDETLGKCQVKATGGVNFDASGTTRITFKSEIYKGIPGTIGYVNDGQQEARLYINLDAGDKEWYSLRIDIGKNKSKDIPSRLYVDTHRTVAELVAADEFVYCYMKLANGPEYWEFEAGQVDIEHYDEDQMRGSFSIIMHHMFYDKNDPDPGKVCVLNGTFDAPVLPYP